MWGVPHQIYLSARRARSDRSRSPKLIHWSMKRWHTRTKKNPSPATQLCSSTCPGDGGTPTNLRSDSKSSWVVSERRSARGSAPHRDPMRWLRKQPRSREIRRQGAPRTTRCSPNRPEDLCRTSDVFSSVLDGAFKPISHKNFLNGPQGARPENLALHTPKAQPNKGATAICRILRITRTS